MDNAFPTGDGGPDRDTERLAHSLAETAVWSPSVHNTQPWWFGFHGSRISLHADRDRWLEVADPAGRELLVSCGAALFTLRLAARARGYASEVTELPDVDRPNLIADLLLARRATTTEEERRLYEQVQHRHTHRGAFFATALPEALLRELRDAAYGEGAPLLTVADPRARMGLAALTESAEQLQRLNPAYTKELARWSFRPGSLRDEGVHPTAYPREPERTEPHYPMRDYARGHGWGVPAEEAAQATGEEAVTGVVALLVTKDDTRLAWLHAGQALQRVLLHAGAAGVSAAFHTQALEVDELRSLIASRLCGGAHPQMLLRLGLAGPGPASPRRRAANVVTPEL